MIPVRFWLSGPIPDRTLEPDLVKNEPLAGY